MVRLTNIQLLILEVLAVGGSLTGGEILQRDEDLIKGTVHTTLRRMAKAGLVTGTAEKRGTVAGHPRVFYRLTPKGEQVLKAERIAQALAAGRVVTIDGTRQ